MYHCIHVQLDVCHAMYSEGEGKESDVDDDDSPMVVGHNIYILAYKLADHKRELKDALEKAEKQGHKAVQHYAKNTAQIEVLLVFQLFTLIILKEGSKFKYQLLLY